VNKAELAHRLGVSLPTLSRWLTKYDRDFPVVERGTNGASYKFDAAAVFAFLRARQEEQLQATAERDEQLSQLKLPFEIPGAEAAPKSSAKDEIEAWKLRRIQREEAERAGQLVPVAQVSDALQTTFARLSRDMHAFVRQIGREQQWPDGYMRAVEARLAQQQRASVAEIQALLATDEGELRVA
jgi:phage terminase Nu1 subunit (DNA packaging protein)